MKIGGKLLSLLCIFITFSCSKEEESNISQEFIKAADMSTLPLIESEGTVTTIATTLPKTHCLL